MMGNKFPIRDAVQQGLRRYDYGDDSLWSSMRERETVLEPFFSTWILAQFEFTGRAQNVREMLFSLLYDEDY